MRKTKKRSRVSRLTDSLKKLGKAVGSRSRKSISFQIMRDEKLYMLVADRIGKKIYRELVSSASPSNNSLFRTYTKDNLETFNWKSLCSDLQRTAPLLSAILQKSLETNRHNVSKPDKHVLISVIAGVMLRNCSQRANFLQSVISLLLYSNHCPKQVQVYIILLLYM